jgi:hypothetical protein
MRAVIPLALVAVSLGLLGAPAAAQYPPGTSAAVDSLRRELVRRFDVDQQGRDSLAQAVARNDTAYLHRLAARDSESTIWLRGVVARFGWPGVSLVGDTAAGTAFLILQHSPDPVFQHEMLPRLWEAARHHDIDPGSVAMLDDRVAIHSGRRRTYGTSFSVRQGCLTLDPVADTAGLDRRRKEVGLPPLRDYARMLGEMYRRPVSLTSACPAP